MDMKQLPSLLALLALCSMLSAQNTNARATDGRYYDAQGRYQGRNDAGRYYDAQGRYQGRNDAGRYYDAQGRYQGRSN